MNTVQTFTATIYLSITRSDGGVLIPSGTISDVIGDCRSYCYLVGLCVTVTETTFVHSDGAEPGCIIGLINYPRFPSDHAKIREHAIALAKRLKIRFMQKRVSIVFPDETLMIGDDL